jgi:uncharacterized protein YjeT (DUF2065 family)
MSITSWCFILGLICVAVGGAMVLMPVQAGRMMSAFPRHKIAGYVLSAVAWAWAAYAVNTLDIDFINPYKKFLPLVVAVCIPLTWWWMENLLPCRALSGILMLFPCEMLYAVRAHESDWRLLLVTLAYLAIVKGMFFMLYPWRMRQCITWTTAHPMRMRVVGAMDLLIGVLLIGLGMTVFAS